MATTDDARLKRDSEEGRIRALLARLGHVKGLWHGYTVYEDVCTGPKTGNFLEPASGPLMACSMSVSAVFGVEGEVTEVLRRIEAAAIVRWKSNVNGPGSAPAGSLDYALEYHRLRGVFPDGLLMPAPYLESENGAVTISWDYPGLPGSPPAASQVGGKEAPVCPPESPIYSLCHIDPLRPQAVPEIRARYGTVLKVEIRPAIDGGTYLTVPRPR
ncbi:hypothetical protein ACFV0C_38435 [Streptomyces sp. NPDC059568]|uniref:hypothetical protein n=1 Tax=Streptomyces sp. NPDC059568 TaxID=3346868 RepID=UPI00368AF7D6